MGELLGREMILGIRYCGITLRRTTGRKYPKRGLGKREKVPLR
jgi:hypothetical protein